MYAPRFPKPQSEGFFLVVADTKTDEVLALKRISWHVATQGKQASQPNPKPTSRSKIRLPPADGERMVSVKVVSDGYIGMEWHVEDVEIPAPPRVVDDGLKKKQG
ncbi:hypothetical protein KCU73_g9881, partial [Aureobasidium melanogenum]